MCRINTDFKGNKLSRWVKMFYANAPRIYSPRDRIHWIPFSFHIHVSFGYHCVVWYAYFEALCIRQRVFRGYLRAKILNAICIGIRTKWPNGAPNNSNDAFKCHSWLSNDSINGMKSLADEVKTFANQNRIGENSNSNDTLPRFDQPTKRSRMNEQKEGEKAVLSQSAAHRCACRAPHHR